MKNSNALPKISLITVVKNGDKTLEKTIQSVLAQEYPNVEYIIIDGGSTDETLKIIQRYEANIAYWHSIPDRGGNDAYNIGLSHSTGDLVAFLNADDWYEPTLLHRIANAFLENPDAGILTCAGNIVQWNPDKSGYKTEWQYTRKNNLELTFKNICYGVSAIGCRFIVRDLFERIGVFAVFDDKACYRLTADKEFLLKASLIHTKNVFVDFLGHHYLAHQDSSTFGKNRANVLRICEEHIQIAEKLLHEEKLSSKQIHFLNNWILDQSARLFYYTLLEKKFSPALARFWKYFQKNSLSWITTLFLATPYRIIRLKIMKFRA